VVQCERSPLPNPNQWTKRELTDDWGASPSLVYETSDLFADSRERHLRHIDRAVDTIIYQGMKENQLLIPSPSAF